MHKTTATGMKVEIKKFQSTPVIKYDRHRALLNLEYEECNE